MVLSKNQLILILKEIEKEFNVDFDDLKKEIISNNLICKKTSNIVFKKEEFEKINFTLNSVTGELKDINTIEYNKEKKVYIIDAEKIRNKKRITIDIKEEDMLKLLLKLNKI